MLLLSHIIIALASVVYASYLILRPSKTGLRVSYGLVAATLASGTYLVVSTGAPMLSSCMSGLFYTGFVSVVLAYANRKLALQESTIKDQ
jgi:hypothetical protein